MDDDFLLYPDDFGPTRCPNRARESGQSQGASSQDGLDMKDPGG